MYANSVAPTSNWKFNLKTIHIADNATLLTATPALNQEDLNKNFIRMSPKPLTIGMGGQFDDSSYTGGLDRLNYTTNPPTISVFDDNDNFSF